MSNAYTGVIFIKDKICGIYYIKNNINKKIYVGQSVDINRRFKDHKTRLNSNKHGNIHLQKAWSKYGSDNFDFGILEHCNRNQLDCKEKYWIQFFNSNNDCYGYNLTSGGKSFVLNENYQGYIGKSLNKKRCPILQFSIKGVLIRKWRCINDIFSENPTWAQTPLMNHLREPFKFHTVNNCIWIREKDLDETFLSQMVERAKLKNGNINRMIKINQLDENMNIVKTWNSISEAKVDGFNKECIIRHMKNGTMYKGYYFKKSDG